MTKDVPLFERNVDSFWEPEFLWPLDCSNFWFCSAFKHSPVNTRGHWEEAMLAFHIIPFSAVKDLFFKKYGLDEKESWE